MKLKRADLATHQQTCPLITMGPYLEAQNSRLDSLELTVRHLRQRNEVFEDGLANIRSSLVDSSPPPSRNQQSHTDDSPDRSGSGSGPDTPNSSSNSNSTQTTYLLALHESLRDQVGQLSHAITDLDARASMAIMNECLRIKEDMAHTNAAMNSVRMQVQWLMNPRLHGRAVRTDTSTSTATAANGSGPSNSTSTTPGYGTGSLRPRRVSDSGREGTKL